VRKLNPKTSSLPLRVIQWVVDIAFIVAIVGYIVLFALQFIPSSPLKGSEWVERLHNLEDPTLAIPAGWFGLRWPLVSGFSFLPLGGALVVWLVKIAVDAFFIAGSRAIERWVTGAPAEAGAAHWVPDHVTAMTADSEESREELLRRYREIEAALKSARRKRCVFLSIDVVGSTRMKAGESEANIAATFQAYEEMLRKIFDQFAAWKQAWTPDGVMVCFLQPELALGAAKRILESMNGFNESDNKLRTPFQVRCGMNEGEVPIFEDSRLEKIADQVIDLAGHLQKQSPPNTLWVTEELYQLFTEQSGFQPANVEVDGRKVCEWRAGSAITSAKS
jgi:class 3 adenylate cyclase